MSAGRVVVFSGGIGGAKLALGLQRVLEPGALMVVANTGDDFNHLGLEISPDLDTLLYTLGGVDNPATGWGRRHETWSFLEALEELGGETWFRLGDRDLATHVERTRRLRAGERLSAIAADFARRLGIESAILPMSDQPVRTQVRTEDGWLDFQDYFVRRRCDPVVTEIRFSGVEEAHPQAALMTALRDETLRAVVVAPSNPFISIEPILALPGLRAALRACNAPIVAVAPIIGGRAIKGPTAKMMRELGLEVSAAAVAGRYGDMLDAYVVDTTDIEACAALDVVVVAAQALMTTLEDRERLASVVLETADRLAVRIS